MEAVAECARDARLSAARHDERVDPLEVCERGVRNARLGALRHVERMDSREVRERGVRDARLVHSRMSSVWIPARCANAASVMPAWSQYDILSVWIPIRCANAASVMPAWVQRNM